MSNISQSIIIFQVDLLFHLVGKSSTSFSSPVTDYHLLHFFIPGTHFSVLCLFLFKVCGIQRRYQHTLPAPSSLQSPFLSSVGKYFRFVQRSWHEITLQMGFTWRAMGSGPQRTMRCCSVRAFREIDSNRTLEGENFDSNSNCHVEHGGLRSLTLQCQRTK